MTRADGTVSPQRPWWHFAALLPHAAFLFSPLRPSDRAMLHDELALRDMAGLPVMLREPARILELSGEHRAVWRPLAGPLHWLGWQWFFAKAALHHLATLLVLAALVDRTRPDARAAVLLLALHPLTAQAVATLEGREMLVTALLTVAFAQAPARDASHERGLSALTALAPFTLHGSLLGLCATRWLVPPSRAHGTARRHGTVVGLSLGALTLVLPNALPPMAPHALDAAARTLRGLLFPYGNTDTPGLTLSVLAWAMVLALVGVFVSQRARFDRAHGTLGALVALSGLLGVALRAERTPPHLAAWPVVMGVCLALGLLPRTAEDPS